MKKPTDSVPWVFLRFAAGTGSYFRHLTKYACPA
jgi:hypothetical protein